MRRLNVIHWAMRQLWRTGIRVPLPHPAVKVLDVGCGSGIWVKEVAEALPRSQVIGVDLSPNLLSEGRGQPLPTNLMFEVSRSSPPAKSDVRSTTSISVFSIPKLVST